jgi:hypothetical protein
MAMISAVPGALLILVILGDAFETILLPRRVIRRIRLARLLFRYTWKAWSSFAGLISSDRGRETYLSYYGPLSLLLLLGMWAAGLILGFALLLHAGGPDIRAMGGADGFGMDLYLSGTTFFTLGLGDAEPATGYARVLLVIESGLGFAFLALVISYLPPLNQSFSQREVDISMLDARAGSPPTAAGILLRNGRDRGLEDLKGLLGDWERWSAELLEIHLSYPILAFFRSQHDYQSWLGALTAILDTCTLIIAGVEGACARQAVLTFAIARHALVDLSLVLSMRPCEPAPDRLPPSGLTELRSLLERKGVILRAGEGADQRIGELRSIYEPYACSLARSLCITLPPWLPRSGHLDNWETSAWDEIVLLRGDTDSPDTRGRHF